MNIFNTGRFNPVRQLLKTITAKRNLLLVAILILLALANNRTYATGFFKQYVVIDRGSGNEYFGNSLAANFQGVNLGSFCPSATFILNGGEANTFQDGSDDVNCNVICPRMWYRIYLQSAGASSFTLVNLGFISQSGNNKTWDKTNLGVNILNSLSAGNYYLEVYFQANATYPPNGNFDFFDSNSGANYKATFTVKTDVSLNNVQATTTPICNTTTTTLTAIFGGTNAALNWWTGAGGTGANKGTGSPSNAVGPGTYYARVTGDCNSPVETQVIVGAKTDVSLSNVQATTTPICNSAITTLTASFSGTNAVLNWWSGTGGTGTNKGTGSPSGGVGPGTYYARVTGDCNSPQEQSVSVGLTNTNTWEGGTGNWSTASSWSCGYAPSATQDVVINGPVFNPAVLTLDVDYTAAGSFTLTDPGNILFAIAPTKVLTVSGTANFNSKLVVFESGVTGSGSFGNKTGTVTGDDAVLVERYIPATGRAWRLLTIPLASSTQTIRDGWCDGWAPIASAAAAAGNDPDYGTLITANAPGSAVVANAAGFDYIDLPQAASSIRRYTSGNWPATAAGTPAMTTTFDNLEEGYMLFVRGDRRVTSGFGSTTLRPIGTLKSGTHNYTVTANAFKLIGNPYASTIDFATIYGHNGTIATKAFWRWDADNGTNGGYVLVQDNGSGGWETVPNEGSTDVTQIHSGQAFFVKGANGGSFSIQESDKVPAGTPVTPPVVFDLNATLGKLFATLYFDNGVNGLQTVDGVQARFADGNTLNANDAGDLSKVYNFNENIALQRNDTQLSVEAHPWIIDNDTLFLSTTNMKVRAYVLQFQPKLLQPGLVATLQDKFLNKDFDIVTGNDIITNYPFTVTADAASAANDRFRIVFKIDPTLPLTLTSAKAYSLNSGVQVDWKTVNENGIRNYEVEKSADGRSFGKAITVAATGAGAYGWYDAAPVKGNNYYRIKGIGTNGDATYSQVLMVNLSSGKSSFSVYPNPVKGGTVGVQFSNMEKGKYSMVVYNSAGQKVASRNITHLGGSATEEINLGTMASGVYRVSLISTSGSVQNQTLVIQK